MTTEAINKREVLDEIHAANMHNWSTNAGMQHRAPKTISRMHLPSVRIGGKGGGGFVRQVLALKADALQVVFLPPIDSELCRRSLLDLSPASDDQ